MTGDTHYELETLAELAEGLLDAATALRVREHLAICDPCGESLADLAAVREMLAATPTPAMPMGVALRIDQALAAEAEGRKSGVGLVEAPAWNDLMRDAPWERETAPDPAPECELEPVAPLGVVSADGTVVPARRRQAARRRRWALPAAVAGVAAAVIGAVTVSSGALSAGGTGNAPPLAQPVLAGDGYQLTDSNWNYTDRELSGSLLEYIGPAQIVDPQDPAEGSKLERCVKQISDEVGTAPFAVDQGFYNGQEANILVFWHDQAANSVRVHVVGPQCDNVRKPAFAHWK